MTPGVVMEIGRQAIEVTLMISAPLLITALVVGLIISIFQAATQLNESTLQFVPKLVVMFLVLLLAGPWMAMIGMAIVLLALAAWGTLDWGSLGLIFLICVACPVTITGVALRLAQRLLCRL